MRKCAFAEAARRRVAVRDLAAFSDALPDVDAVIRYPLAYRLASEYRLVGHPGVERDGQLDVGTECMKRADELADIPTDPSVAADALQTLTVNPQSHAPG